MARVTRHVRASRSEVFAALVRPETYPEWLVGCRDIRAVDDAWPAVGSEFHHRVGLIGPLTIPDSTAVVEIDQGRMLSLEVRARPFVKAQATFTLSDEQPEGDQPVTRITMDEVPIGPLAPLQPLLDPILTGRNVASLNALIAFLNTPEESRSTDRSQAAKTPAN